MDVLKNLLFTQVMDTLIIDGAAVKTLKPAHQPTTPALTRTPISHFASMGGRMFAGTSPRAARVRAEFFDKPLDKRRLKSVGIPSDCGPRTESFPPGLAQMIAWAIARYRRNPAP
jgi:hypothetical protein